MERSKQACINCSAYLTENEKVGYCRARPPLPVMVGQREVRQALMAPGQQGQIEPVILTFFPQMIPSGWCREWQEPPQGD